MKCPVCAAECQAEDMFCDNCGAPLMIMDDRMKALTAFLISKEIISCAEELEKTVELSFSFGTDDGLFSLPPIEPIRCPLYYTENDIRHALVREKRIGSVDFHVLPDFYNVISYYRVNASSIPADEKRPEECGAPVLAEVLANRKNNTVSLIYCHRAEMVSRAGPMECLYGCPTASEIEKRFEGAVQTAEIIDVD